MTVTVNSGTYTADSFAKDAITYTGPGKTVSLRDDLRLARTPAKPTSVFSGVSRTSAKLTRTFTLTGALTPTGEGSIQIDVALPVGMSDAAIDALANDCGAFLSSASFKLTLKQQKINF